jgi:two-component system LytT family response regulator
VIKTSALDYLVWPTNLSAFHEFECRLKDLHSMSSESEEFYTSYKEALRFFSTNLHRLTRKELILPGVRRYVVSRREEIVRIESEGSYSWVFFANSASMLMNKPLQHFDCVLDESNFIRIGQEHLINLNYLKSCQRNEGVSVTLQDGKTIEVSIRRVPLFMEAFSTWSKRRKHNPGLP